MHRDPIRRGLVWGLAATLLLPMVIAVMLGTAAVLGAVGDSTAAAVCRWATLPLAILWGVAIAATTALSAACQLAGRHPPPRRRRIRPGRERNGNG
jgi:hypothetical protein